jgi:hypothetical protein
MAPDHRAELGLVTDRCLAADNKASAADQRVRLLKAKLKAARKSFKAVKRELKAAKKTARHAAKLAKRAQRSLQAALDDLALKRARQRAAPGKAARSGRAPKRSGPAERLATAS